MSKFKFFNRGAKETILLIPGWATDYRVFSTLELRLNYLMPIEFALLRFENDLLKALKENDLDKISIIGWSMGTFPAFDFSTKYPGRVKDIVLVSARRKYNEEVIKNTRISLSKSKKAFLYKFYNNFFSDEEKGVRSWFRKNLLKDYLNKISLNALLEGLDYLLQAEIRTQSMGPKKIRLVHGESDRIAPLNEAQELNNDLRTSEFIVMKRTGHMPFLSERFKRVFDDNSIE